MRPTPAITRLSLRKGRFYQVEGFPEPFPSVTTVLGIIAKPALIPWARNVALESVRAALTERIGGAVWLTPEWVDGVITEAWNRPDQMKAEAADFGTQAHILIEQIIQGLPLEIPPQFVTIVSSFEDWRRGAGLDIQLTETMVYSATHRYAGAMDALASREWELVALDWKTSNGLYPSCALQVAAYAKAMAEMSGKPVRETWMVRLGKTAPSSFRCGGLWVCSSRPSYTGWSPPPQCCRQ